MVERNIYSNLPFWKEGSELQSQMRGNWFDLWVTFPHLAELEMFVNNFWETTFVYELTCSGTLILESSFIFSVHEFERLHFTANEKSKKKIKEDCCRKKIIGDV